MKFRISVSFGKKWIEHFEEYELKRYLFDTDVIIDYLRGQEQAIEYISTFEHDFFISPISIAELYSGVKGEQEVSDLEYFMSLFTVWPITAEIAKEAGILRQKYINTHGMGLADAMIATTARVYEANLVSLNTRHFAMLEYLIVPYSK